MVVQNVWSAAHRTTGPFDRQEPLTVQNILPILEKSICGEFLPTEFLTYWRRPVAEKAKTAQKADALRTKRSCPLCGGESKVVQFAGFGQLKGFFWVCDKNSEHISRTR